jgi:site-specific DNA-methyltransferase (adenine-specific)/site-specific DNA-methyltransferase (cytosine-N4-specific)
MELKTDLLLGDAKVELQKLPENSVDLVVTSPPYADQRKDTYGGIAPDKYVEWFLPISEQLLRVLKPTGTFILNIKERVIDGERSTYVMELILAMRKQGWLWTEEFIWHKKIVIRANGLIVFGTHGSDCFNLIKVGNLICTKKK